MKGITIQLAVRTRTGTDSFGQPEYTDEMTEVDDVLVGEPSVDEINNALTMYGKSVQYKLAIPKGDEHEWEDTSVILPEPFAGVYRTVGYPTAGIEANIPLRWNKKVLVAKVNE